ncbi:MAG: hypothetical protein V9E88_05145 [Ferruginibacter sp.]
MRKKSTQMGTGNLVSFISRCYPAIGMLSSCRRNLSPRMYFRVNRFNGWEGQTDIPLTPYNADYRTTVYRRISVNTW